MHVLMSIMRIFHLLSDEVSFQWKNPDFPSINPDFLLKNVGFLMQTGPVSR